MYGSISLVISISICVEGITGNALPEDIDFFVSSGADQVVTKPLSRAKLLEALYHLVPTAMASEEDRG
jgi:CheY-like chemotaxis protein